MAIRKALKEKTGTEQKWVKEVYEIIIESEVTKKAVYCMCC